MEYLFQLVGMAVTLVAVVIGFQAILAVVRPKPRRTRLRVQPIAPAAPRRYRGRRHRQPAPDPLEEVVGLLFQLPMYLIAVVQTARRTALGLRADYVAPRAMPVGVPAMQAAETARNVSETPETVAETTDVPATSDITTDAVGTDAPPPSAEETEQVVIAVLAKLLAAQVIKSETRALETAFAVNAGGGKEYQRLKGLLKEALAALEPKGETVALTQQVPVVSSMPQRAKAA